MVHGESPFHFDIGTFINPLRYRLSTAFIEARYRPLSSAVVWVCPNRSGQNANPDGNHATSDRHRAARRAMTGNASGSA